MSYEVRLARALEHLEQNLHRRVPLEELAQVAGFAPHHFHRVFKALLGQTAADHALRLRLEKAAFLLKYGSARRRLTEVAMELGFSESSDFSRAFSRHFGTSPSAFRAAPQRFRQRKRRPFVTPKRALRDNDDGFRVQLVQESSQRLGYVRVHGSYVQPQKMMEAAAKVASWAKAQGITHPLVGMAEDDPELTPLEQCRYDFAVPLPEAMKPPRWMATRTLEAGTTATLEVQGQMPLLARAWDWLFQVWLPASRYEPRGAPAREHYLDGGAGAPEFFDLLYVLPVRQVSWLRDDPVVRARDDARFVKPAAALRG